MWPVMPLSLGCGGGCDGGRFLFVLFRDCFSVLENLSYHEKLSDVRGMLLFGLLCVLVVCCGQVIKGTWWMPWHREPMKDVGACEMPWGVGNRALIRGCPNGETQLELCPVTHI